jgi:RNA polymerase sigma-70 factor (ECF subfamily)
MHYERLRRFVRARVSNPEEADDIVQEVCLRAVTRIDSIRDPERVESWLFQIARNAIIDHYRRNRPVAALPDELIGIESIDEPALPDISGCLPGLLDGMDAGDREALKLTAIDGLKQRELADQLGLSLSGAKSRVQRARKRLRDMVLACCRPELDRLGGIINIHPSQECRAESECGCPSGCPSC